MLALVFRKSGKTSWKANRVPMAGEGRAEGFAAANSSASSLRVQSGHVYTEKCGRGACAAKSLGLRYLLAFDARHGQGYGAYLWKVPFR